MIRHRSAPCLHYLEIDRRTRIASSTPVASNLILIELKISKGSEVYYWMVRDGEVLLFESAECLGTYDISHRKHRIAYLHLLLKAVGKRLALVVDFQTHRCQQNLLAKMVY